MSTNKTLCPIPWISQSIRSNGDIRVCCHASHGPNNGIVRDEKGTPFKASDANFSEVMNSTTMKDVRRTMMNGKWHSECKRCQDEENSNITSRRDYETDLWINSNIVSWEHLLKNTNSDGSINTDEIKTHHYDLRFGNLCNLKCRMCGPADSSQWYEDHVKLWGDKFKDSHGKVQLVKTDKNKYAPEYDIYSWYENADFWSNMEENIPYIKRLYLVGGEPFMIDQHYDFLQKCIEMGYSKNIVLEYNSNITNIPKRAYDIWEHFKKVLIGASIDGVGLVNDYIRYPSKFSKIEQNLKKLHSFKENINVWAASTISIYNIWYYPEFMIWMIENFPLKHNNKYTSTIIPHPLHGPKFLSIKVLPEEIKAKVQEHFNNSKPLITEAIEKQNYDESVKKIFNTKMFNLLDKYSQFMFSENKVSHWPEFWDYTHRLDTIRGHSMEKNCPEFYEIIKEHKNDTK